MADLKEVKRDVKLAPTGARPAEGVRNVWAATAAYGVTKEDIENPVYWSHVCARFRPKDRIEVHSEDGAFYAEYMVTSCDRTWAKVVCLMFVELNKAAKLTDEQVEGIHANYEVMFRGPKKWSVIRKSDRATLHEGLHTKEDAKKWLDVHLSAQGVAA